MAKTKEHIYYVKGMHCASCEVLIEKKLLELKGIKSVEASVNKGQVLIEYEGEKPSSEELNKIFQKENYVFSDKPMEIKERFPIKEFFSSLAIALLILAVFVILNKSGLIGLINVNSKSSLAMFFLFGVLAGLSTCAALIGGLILSMSKQWSEHKYKPHLMFNAGRIISYTALGGLLGLIGSKLQISLTPTSLLVIGVSVIMILLGLQMIGFKAFRKFQITMPKFITRYVANEKNFHGQYMPFLLGALTFFLPCGFTVTAQGLSLLSGNPVQGGLIMLSFALGTLPMLSLIGFSSVKFSQRPHLSNKFLKVAGILVLFFALYNINSQLNVLGIKNLSNLNFKLGQNVGNVKNQEKGLAPIVNGKQILKMEASSYGYKPNYFKVKAGIPVRWEITDIGTSGCTNAVISKSLFEGEIPLTPGQTSIKEFTPEKPGKYKFSCWMGMISGVIEVVDKENSSINANTNADSVPISSGVSGCGCGGGTICGGGGSCCSGI